MCDAVHTTRALSLRRSVAHVAVPRPSTTTHPRRNQWSRRRTFATQSYSATPRVGQGRRCRRGPRTHVWGRHVDCVGRLRVQVPRPTDDAQVKRRTRQAPQNGSSLVRPLAPTNRTVGWVVVESPGRIPRALSFSGAGGSTNAAKVISLRADRWRQSPALARATAVGALVRLPPSHRQGSLLFLDWCAYLEEAAPMLDRKYRRGRGSLFARTP